MITRHDTENTGTHFIPNFITNHSFSSLSLFLLLYLICIDVTHNSEEIIHVTLGFTKVAVNNSMQLKKNKNI